MNLNVKELKNLDPTDEYAAGQGYFRLVTMFRHDPLVSILSKEAYEGLANAIFSNHGVALGAPAGRLAVSEPEHVRTGVMDAFLMSPLSILTDAFKEHVAGLAILAIFPEDVT